MYIVIFFLFTFKLESRKKKIFTVTKFYLIRLEMKVHQFEERKKNGNTALVQMARQQPSTSDEI
ncbi:hypothetical protein DERF_008304 [Dermatophagoides farinae]|uniref:Uncharacterized protein n=1 Tax=Dermatophagoides farinae TaxID=6954 RepID=A0A922I025_DERFA|nr:hypothetical protein DERF_008304 [Dermatophagoides farinae]